MTSARAVLLWEGPRVHVCRYREGQHIVSEKLSDFEIDLLFEAVCVDEEERTAKRDAQY